MITGHQKTKGHKSKSHARSKWNALGHSAPAPLTSCGALSNKEQAPGTPGKNPTPGKNSGAWHEFAAACAAFGPESRPAANFARFFVIFAAAHFFLDPAAFHQFTEAADGFLNALTIADNKLNHRASQTNSAWPTTPGNRFRENRKPVSLPPPGPVCPGMFAASGRRFPVPRWVASIATPIDAAPAVRGIPRECEAVRSRPRGLQSS